jgi:hypothetical protein
VQNLARAGHASAEISEITGLSAAAHNRNSCPIKPRHARQGLLTAAKKSQKSKLSCPKAKIYLP